IGKGFHGERCKEWLEEGRLLQLLTFTKLYNQHINSNNKEFLLEYKSSMPVNYSMVIGEL
ncbi:hypothetical protein STEG23_005256, partial [Scotinomys teguina]